MGCSKAQYKIKENYENHAMLLYWVSKDVSLCILMLISGILDSRGDAVASQGLISTVRIQNDFIWRL